MLKADKNEIRKLTKEILKIASKNHVYLTVCIFGEDSEPWGTITDVPHNHYKDDEYVELTKAETRKSRLINKQGE